MIPLEKVKSIIEKHSKLEIELSSTNIDKKKFAEMSKEYSDLNVIIDDAPRRKASLICDMSDRFVFKSFIHHTTF